MHAQKNMHAIIKSGGKQHRVGIGDIIDVELLEGEIGSKVQFGEVLFMDNGSKTFVGGPHVKDCIVFGELVDEVDGPKVTCVKYIPGNHRKKIGHKQHYSRVKITQIEHKGGHHGA